MSQSTTTAGSQGESQPTLNVYSQEATYQQQFASAISYADRQDEFQNPSQQSIVPSSLDVPLDQLSQGQVMSTQSVSATPTPTLSTEDKARQDIARMNEEFKKHGYKAFVDKNMHLMYRVYPFDLSEK
jgi:hypothetical protein